MLALMLRCSHLFVVFSLFLFNYPVLLLLLLFFFDKLKSMQFIRNACAYWELRSPCYPWHFLYVCVYVTIAFCYRQTHSHLLKTKRTEKKHRENELWDLVQISLYSNRRFSTNHAVTIQFCSSCCCCCGRFFFSLHKMTRDSIVCVLKTK